MLNPSAAFAALNSRGALQGAAGAARAIDVTGVIATPTRRASAATAPEHRASSRRQYGPRLPGVGSRCCSCCVRLVTPGRRLSSGLMLAWATAGMDGNCTCWYNDAASPGALGYAGDPSCARPRWSEQWCSLLRVKAQRQTLARVGAAMSLRAARPRKLTAPLAIFLAIFPVGIANASMSTFRDCYPNHGGPNLFPHNVEVRNISCTAADRAIGAGHVTKGRVSIPGYTCHFVGNTSFESSGYSCTR